MRLPVLPSPVALLSVALAGAAASTRAAQAETLPVLPSHVCQSPQPRMVFDRPQLSAIVAWTQAFQTVMGHAARRAMSRC